MTRVQLPQSEAVVPAVVRQILERRGIAPEAVGAFLYPNYDTQLHDPFLMTDMRPAVERLIVAAKRRERVVVYGDYDIDGITASTVMIEGLAAIGIAARSYIPDRFEEGYGINAGALEQLKSQGVQLVVSVDCGITSVEEAAWAREHGLDLIITDHHTPPDVIPEAVAVVNPKRPGDTYPCKDLCGAGVAFKVIQALQQLTGQPAVGQEKWLLDLVALGTVCDIVELTDENRVLASYGLRVMRQTRRPGLRALAGVAGVGIDSIASQHLGFGLGPRLNAAGRLEHAARALELVSTSDTVRAADLAEELNTLNTQRRATQATVVAAADQLAAQYAADPVLVLADPNWSHGIVGIVASKLMEKWHKPVLVAQVMGEHTKGSARSTGSFNMVAALRAKPDLFSKYGGHFYAAGYTLPTARLHELRQHLNAYFVAEQADTSPPAIVGDVALADLSEVTWTLYEALELMQPFGQANPEPVLELSGLTARMVKPIGADKTHLRLELSDRLGRRLAAIGFGMTAKHPDLKEGMAVTVLGTLNNNIYQGRSTLQLLVTDIRYE